jgi:hypothetical protein
LVDEVDRIYTIYNVYMNLLVCCCWLYFLYMSLEIAPKRHISYSVPLPMKKERNEKKIMWFHGLTLNSYSSYDSISFIPRIVTRRDRERREKCNGIDAPIIVGERLLFFA